MFRLFLLLGLAGCAGPAREIIRVQAEVEGRGQS
jgi:hypothetical protein